MMQGSDDENNPFYTGEEKLLPSGSARSSAQPSYALEEPDPSELTFQTFSHSTVNMPTGSDRSPMMQSAPNNNTPIGGAGIGPSEFDTTSETAPSLQPRGPPTGSHFWSLAYYSHLFDVDTTEVLQRVVRSMLPFKFSFVQYTSNNPDLYGPFWIATTLLFVMAFAGNLANFFQMRGNWTYDFNRITFGATTIYGYSIVIPFIMWAVFKWMKMPFRLIELLCIYGYSLFVFIPACLLCIIPRMEVQWAVTAVAAGLSGWFLVSNLIPPLRKHDAKLGMITLVVIAVLHLGLALAFKMYFFQLESGTSSSAEQTQQV
eukprot:TRINITY_DN2973_c0_g1_i1.p1 TRINITY_DN2973_c0_g1~~TRINITY_DN2973_c0_g1_i1.p1  ORF type:complete len:316 (-),score=60.90 TRINITY_DN2973_c0_g1_i1:90-1037(-)